MLKLSRNESLDASADAGLVSVNGLDDALANTAVLRIPVTKTKSDTTFANKGFSTVILVTLLRSKVAESGSDSVAVGSESYKVLTVGRDCVGHDDLEAVKHWDVTVLDGVVAVSAGVLDCTTLAKCGDV